MSGELEGSEVDLHALTGGASQAAVGVPHARELIALAEAVVGGGEAELAVAREAALAALGPEGFVAATAVAANFERMDRIADATGIPLDAPLDAISGAMRAELGLERFASAANTPRGSWARRSLGRALAPFARYVMPLLAARSRKAFGRSGPR